MRPRYSDNAIKEAVAQSKSWAATARFLGIAGQSRSSSEANIKRRAIRLGIDSSHFTGNKNGFVHGPKRPLEAYLTADGVDNGIYLDLGPLRKRLIKEGIKQEQCELCGRSEWEGGKIPLELDHINSNHFDNRLENLQIICANCHRAVTEKRRLERKVPPRKKVTLCPQCGEIKKERSAEVCIDCYVPARKIVWPDDVTLLAMIAESNFLQVSKKLGVTDNAVRKHLGIKPKGPRRPKKEYFCVQCGGARSDQSDSGLCKGCFRQPYKIDWPDEDELLRMISESGRYQVAKKLGVVESSVRFHLQSLERQRSKKSSTTDAV